MRVLVALALLALMQQPGEPAKGRQMLGYYVPYDATSWQSLQAHPEAIDIVAAQWVTIDPCGQIGSRDDQTLKRFAQQNGIAVFPSLVTFSGWLNHQILTDEQTRDRAISGIVEYVVNEGYDGFDLDLEGVDAGDREAYTGFVATLAQALHEQDKQLALALAAKEREVASGWAAAYDYAALGQHADLITIMAYEYRGTWSGPGSVAPYDWMERVVAYATRQIPAHKVLLGIAFYGYDWNTSHGSTLPLGYPQAVELAQRYAADVAIDDTARSGHFTYEALFGDPPPRASGPGQLRHEINVHAPPPCDLAAPPAGPPPTPRPAPPADDIQQHDVWFEESTGAAERLALAARYGVGGVATWRLGQEDPNVWPAVSQWRTGG